MTNAATPKQHMITDSHENKCARQQPDHSDMSESEDEEQGSSKKQAMEADAAPPAITQPIAQPTPPANPWHFLQTGVPNDNNTVNGVITLHNSLKITAPPTGGFPSPQLGQSVWRIAKYEDNVQMTSIKMRNLIALIIGETAATPLLLSTPSAEGDLYKRLPPYHFLISVYALHPRSHVSSYLTINRCPTTFARLNTFTLPDCMESNMEITNLVKQTIHMYPNISLFIHNHIPTPDAEAAIRVINSIRITSLTVTISRSTSHTVWNVYADSLPNMSLKDYFEWT
ncbi:uncharacterized protein F5891DRAFT_1192834 [Suillus fuscotomentosus]|uniref:Uncharacterized protein n=1 Tax=Suillus fuscotomentosus TaxID=1912939 RepID=A0AAD4HHU5_9AGAM|nr:uncharacterized protein F5891DRAFT_1192834 [Suillus fuscotomentosus]KAG1896711.1 hypothetical protein F5891DRAFT_1192834 [Suillus fuscotomentosus]